MSRAGWRRRVAVPVLALALVLAPALAPVGAQARPEFARPAYAGAYEPEGVDERGLWMQLDEAERALRDAPGLLRDAALDAYLRGVLCRTVGFDRCGAVRLYVLRDSSFNAMMAPNGLGIVHTGLLARVHSEAELAAVLGHEFAHFELRHSLASFRARRRMGDFLSWISLAGAVAHQSTASVQNAIVASYFAFSREQEKQADLLSAAFLRATPYPLRASAIWRRVMEEDDALRAERKLARRRALRPDITDTHPTEAQRFAYFATLEAEPGAADGEDHAADYRTQTARLMPELFDALVRSNTFAGSDYVLRARGDALGWDALTLFERAELYRLRGNPRDLATARAFYERAAAMDGAPAECWRGLGLAALRLGDAEAGRAALRAYLVKAPQAPDAATMATLLED